MARIHRFCPSGYAYHVIQRGNNRNDCFIDQQDYAAYASWLSLYSTQSHVAIHAWVFMTNHVHLLVTPAEESGISTMMQAVGRRYVTYFNKRHSRTGTLWEGRFKSSLVQSDTYLFNCYRYIELNPVRANMVNDPSQYHWSSFHSNAMGADSSLCTPHDYYIQLGCNARERQEQYKALFEEHLDENDIEKIRQSINTGTVLGNGDFIEQLETVFSIKITKKKRGRPKKT